MNSLRKTFLAAALIGIAFHGLSLSASAADVERIKHSSPFTAESVHVPPGYSYYFLSGVPSTFKDLREPKGSPQSFGDVTAQTRSELDNMKANLAKYGLTFRDVVEAHVFMIPDPANNGHANFDAMNKVWATEFGTKAQPNLPARSAISVSELRGQGMLLEIEMIAVKKAS
jgi:enamine deaminase RidA (YjgF/YER057c/UK114 family)